TELRLGLPGSE
nr:Chain E, EAR motif of IAA27 [synthetic construct]5NQV_F Chain F, EAR motif of IAA27 [synthetic construct]5NQV_G Chain G, EAR motif of IAA27 [synthetic construct]5NQV_H Chain H, EAR motif of IAA27 [synthetic construct]